MNEFIETGTGTSLTTLTRIAGAIVLALAIEPALATTQGSERNGQEVVATVCVNCHGAGVDGAPRIGDTAAWGARSARGLGGLSQNALAGIRKMPAHGGNPRLSDTEIERAIAYMVNQSGGHWVEPISRTAAPVGRSGEQVVAAYCAACHSEGLGGAPKIGDRAAWIPRSTQGIDYLTRSAINGHGGMPPRGGVANLTDKEIQGAIGYMLNPARTVASAAPAAPTPGNDNHRIVEGTDIYFGIASAEALLTQHPGNDAESAMHGRIPAGSGYYHVMISLFDNQTHAPVVGADVKVKVADAMGRAEQVKALEPMVVNDTVSYGNYFRLPMKDPYTIAVSIRMPGAARPIETKFGFQR